MESRWCRCEAASAGWTLQAGVMIATLNVTQFHNTSVLISEFQCIVSSGILIYVSGSRFELS